MRLATLALVAAACHRTPTPTDPRTTLPRLEATRLEALGRADVAALDPLLDSELVLTLGTLERTKPQILGRIRAQKAANTIIDERADAVIVHAFGSIAVTRGTAITREPDGREQRFRFTNVWRWRDARWQLVVGHVQ